MITVRMPDGTAVQFNSANYVKRFSNFSDLYTGENGSWVAQVPLEALIELVAPCRVYRVADRTDERIGELAREVRLLKQTVAKFRKVK